MASEDSKYSPEARDVIVTVPNAISALRIVSIPFIAWLIAGHRMVGALVLLAISSASDGVDGLIARKCNQVSKIGQILDPIADRLLIPSPVVLRSQDRPRGCIRHDEHRHNELHLRRKRHGCHRILIQPAEHERIRRGHRCQKKTLKGNRDRKGCQLP